MVETSNPWDRPPGSKAPCRPGDRTDTPLFTALGRAVSSWEGVQAATANVYCSFLDSCGPEFEARVGAFGEVSKVHQRAKQLTQIAEEFLLREAVPIAQANDIRIELRGLMAAYRGWAERRNDLAHGYVTSAESPDYTDDHQPLITTHSLLPSHARTQKWVFAQPEFNYAASEIETFARAFQELDDTLELLASKITKPKENSLVSP